VPCANFEIRSSKSETNPNFEIKKSPKRLAPGRLGFRYSDFEFVSDFELRISDLVAAEGCAKLSAPLR
jgi:hypothetical protein